VVGDALVSRHDDWGDRKWAGPRTQPPNHTAHHPPHTTHHPAKANSESKTKQEGKAKHELALEVEICILYLGNYYKD